MLIEQPAKMLLLGKKQPAKMLIDDTAGSWRCAGRLITMTIVFSVFTFNPHQPLLLPLLVPLLVLLYAKIGRTPDE
jgi:hypothetical protein